LDGAEKIFTRLYESNPDNIQALSILINVLERNQKYEAGIKFLEDWIERNPRDSQAQIKLSIFKSKI
jgi:tetratricopeptide (TPR) repeat protein